MNDPRCARNDPRRLEFSHPAAAHTPVDRRDATVWAIDPPAIRRRLGDHS